MLSKELNGGSVGLGRSVLAGGASAVISLVEREMYRTTVTGGDWDPYVISGEEFSRLGPALVDLVMHGEGEAFHVNFRYRVKLQVRLSDGVWEDPGGSPVYVFGSAGTPISSPTYQISDVFTDRKKLGIQNRLVLEVQNNAAAAPISARLTLAVAVRLHCGC